MYQFSTTASLLACYKNIIPITTCIFTFNSSHIRTTENETCYAITNNDLLNEITDWKRKEFITD